MRRETPNSASQPATLRQERDWDQRKIWRECLRDRKSCKCSLCSSVSVLISSLCLHPSSVFPLLLPQMLPGGDGITGIVPWQHFSGWSGPDRRWTSQGLITGERSQQDQSSAGTDFYSRHLVENWAFIMYVILLKTPVLWYHRWSFSSRRCTWGRHLWFCQSDGQRIWEAAPRTTVFPTAPLRSQEVMLHPMEPSARWFITPLKS